MPCLARGGGVVPPGLSCQRVPSQNNQNDFSARLTMARAVRMAGGVTGWEGEIVAERAEEEKASAKLALLFGPGGRLLWLSFSHCEPTCSVAEIASSCVSGSPCRCTEDRLFPSDTSFQCESEVSYSRLLFY